MLLSPSPGLGPPTVDRLGVLTSTWELASTLPQVILDGQRVGAVAATWANQPWPESVWDTELHFFDGTQRTLNWMLVLDALNFCFWAEAGQPRWQVEWHGHHYNGYNALAASLSRAMEEGYPLGDATFLAAMDAPTLAQILRPVADAAGVSTSIPLFAERLANVREAGSVLRDQFGGNFSALLATAQGDAVAAVSAIVAHLPSFRDTATWQGQPVLLYKRPQILIADVASSFAGHAWGTFAHLDQLTAFADYKVPMLLRRLGILDYAPALAERIERFELIPAGSEDEVAIRAATIWGVEWLRLALTEHGVTVTAAAIDLRLWLAGLTADAADRPYHRTRTIYY